MLYIIVQELCATVRRSRQKLNEQKLQVKSIMLENMSGVPPTIRSNNFNFVENAFQNQGVGGGGGGGAMEKMNQMNGGNDEEEVYSRTTYSSMYTGGQPQLMTVIDDSETRATANVLAMTNNDETAITPETHRKRLRLAMVALIFALLFILIANVVLLARVKFVFFTLLAILVNPVAIIVGYVMKRFSFF